MKFDEREYMKLFYTCSPFFEKATSKMLENLVLSSNFVSFAPNTTIIAEGE